MRPDNILEIVRRTLQDFVGPDERLTEKEAEEELGARIRQLEKKGKTTFVLHGPKTSKGWSRVVVELWFDQNTEWITKLEVTEVMLLPEDELQVLQNYLRTTFFRRGILHSSSRSSGG